MALRTPLSSGRKQITFMEPCNKLDYYEDVYRRADEDELFSEPATPKSKRRGIGIDRFGEINENRKAPSVFEAFRVSKSAPSDNTKHRISTSTADKLPLSPSTQKLLTPKRFGMFSPTATAAAQTLNTAGEAMNDLLGLTSLDALDDGFRTLDEDAGDIVPQGVDNSKLNLETSTTSDQATMDGQLEQTQVEETDVLQQTSGTQSAFDGDVEDNTSETDGKGGKKEEVASRREKKKPGRPRKTQNPPAALTARRSLRHQEKIERAKQAKDQQDASTAIPRKVPQTKAAAIMARKRRDMSARAIKLLDKAERNAERPSVAKLRNWKGEKMDTKHGFVEVLTDETDSEQYVRC